MYTYNRFGFVVTVHCSPKAFEILSSICGFLFSHSSRTKHDQSNQVPSRATHSHHSYGLPVAIYQLVVCKAFSTGTLLKFSNCERGDVLRGGTILSFSSWRGGA